MAKVTFYAALKRDKKKSLTTFPSFCFSDAKPRRDANRIIAGRTPAQPPPAFRPDPGAVTRLDTALQQQQQQQPIQQPPSSQAATTEKAVGQGESIRILRNNKWIRIRRDCRPHPTTKAGQRGVG